MLRTLLMGLLPLLLISSTSRTIPSPQEDLAGAAAALPFPQDYRTQMVLYGVVDRPDGMVRKMYVSRSALQAVQKAQSYPTTGDALYVIENYRAQSQNQKYLLDPQKHLIPRTDPETIHVMQRRTNVPGAMDNWNTQSFLYQSQQIDASSSMAECWICHESARQRDFVFSQPVLKKFLKTGQVQRWDCHKPQRQLCDQHLDIP